jgi:hypothetical protein
MHRMTLTRAGQFPRIAAQQLNALVGRFTLA